MSLQIAQYQGKSLVSKIIGLLTYSCYSHSAVLFGSDMEVEVGYKTHFIASGSVVEAWKGGVRLAGSLSENHEPRTRVDVFAPKTPLTTEQEKKIASFLIQNIGKKYAYLNVLRFVPIMRLLMPKPLPMQYNRTHVFCSELVLEGFGLVVKLLERCQFWEVPPRDLPRSPLLYFVKSVWTD
jgi:hypothetical protein